MIKKYVLFTFSGEGIPVMDKLQKEGEDVLIAQIEDVRDTLTKEELKSPKKESFEEKKRRMSQYDGMIKKYPASRVLSALKKIKNPENYFLFFDLNTGFKFSEQLKDLGFPGNFPTTEDREFETDRNKGKDFCKEHYPDVKVAEVKEFKSVEEAKEFLEENENIYVLKGMGDDATTVLPDTDDVELAKEQILDALEADTKVYESAGFILEQMIPEPIELTPQRMYYDGKLIFTDLDIELKKLGAGGTGFMTGCSADLVFPIPDKCRLAEIAFPPIVDELAKKHKGLFIWDISLLVDPRTGKFYMGEFCPNRFGWNAFYTELCQLDRVSDFFEAVAEGRNPFEYAIGKYGASVRLFNLPDKAPYLENGNDLKNRNVSWKEEVENDLWIMDIFRKGEKFLTSGYTWDLAVATGQGDTIHDAVERAYETIKGFSFQGVYFRPKHDYLTSLYSTAIMRRYDYVRMNGLIDGMESMESLPMLPATNIKEI